MSRRKRLLVVGGGSIGERHARCFGNPHLLRDDRHFLCETIDMVGNDLDTTYSIVDNVS